jgi:hypothetical protein
MLGCQSNLLITSAQWYSGNVHAYDAGGPENDPRLPHLFPFF